jgi:hypothetical protein
MVAHPEFGWNPGILDAQPSSQAKALYKRIWWSCFVADNITSLAFRKAPILQATDFNIQKLEISDFDLRPLPIAIADALGGNALLIKTDLQHQLSKLFIANVDLCLLLNRIMSPNQGLSVFDKRMPSESQTIQEMERMAYHEQQLREWYDDETTIILSGAIMHPDSDDILLFHQSILFIVFDGAVGLILSRRSLLQPPLSTCDDRKHIEVLQERRISAASGVIASFIHVGACHDLNWLPSAITALLLPATITHLTGLGTANPVRRAQCVLYLRQSFQILRQIGLMYPVHKQWAFLVERAANNISNRNLSGVDRTASVDCHGPLRKDVSTPSCLHETRPASCTIPVNPLRETTARSRHYYRSPEDGLLEDIDLVLSPSQQNEWWGRIMCYAFPPITI